MLVGHWVIELSSGDRICVEARTARQAEIAVEQWLIEAMKPTMIFSPSKVCSFADLTAALSHTTKVEQRREEKLRADAERTAAWIERELAHVTPAQNAHFVEVMTKFKRMGMSNNCRRPEVHDDPTRPS